MVPLLAETAIGDAATIAGVVGAIVAGILAGVKSVGYVKGRRQRSRARSRTAAAPDGSDLSLCDDHEKALAGLEVTQANHEHRLNTLEKEAQARLETLAGRFEDLESKVTVVHARVDELLLKLAFK
jgi:uncharacterized protein HemX